MMHEWEAPQESASEWLEQATGPWRKGHERPTTEHLLQAAQVAALLAIGRHLDALARRGESAED